eukprot:TRINITY_DN9997_c0_g1_i2.p1 TRINITY_DN9997_c0_g1~~TRINITY_DN9997_c0_g1_i2.p1  ORF type:complete len:592 (+),score=-21.22 TRINITY_DN9997_c0_g1_i2:350-2125(+)
MLGRLYLHALRASRSTGWLLWHHGRGHRPAYSFTCESARPNLGFTLAKRSYSNDRCDGAPYLAWDSTFRLGACVAHESLYRTCRPAGSVMYSIPATFGQAVVTKRYGASDEKCASVKAVEMTPAGLCQPLADECPFWSMQAGCTAHGTNVTYCQDDGCNRPCQADRRLTCGEQGHITTSCGAGIPTSLGLLFQREYFAGNNCTGPSGILLVSAVLDACIGGSGAGYYKYISPPDPSGGPSTDGSNVDWSEVRIFLEKYWMAFLAGGFIATLLFFSIFCGIRRRNRLRRLSPADQTSVSTFRTPMPTPRNNDTRLHDFSQPPYYTQSVNDTRLPGRSHAPAPSYFMNVNHQHDSSDEPSPYFDIPMVELPNQPRSREDFGAAMPTRTAVSSGTNPTNSTATGTEVTGTQGATSTGTSSTGGSGYEVKSIGSKGLVASPTIDNHLTDVRLRTEGPSSIELENVGNSSLAFAYHAWWFNPFHKSWMTTDYGMALEIKPGQVKKVVRRSDNKDEFRWFVVAFGAATFKPWNSPEATGESRLTPVMQRVRLAWFRSLLGIAQRWGAEFWDKAEGTTSVAELQAKIVEFEEAGYDRS